VPFFVRAASHAAEHRGVKAQISGIQLDEPCGLLDCLAGGPDLSSSAGVGVLPLGVLRGPMVIDAGEQWAQQRAAGERLKRRLVANAVRHDA
jgi:hypothetical protein